MKKVLLTLVALLLIVACTVGMYACDKGGDNSTAAETAAEGSEIEATGLWASAKYRSDTTVGEGSKTVSFDVEAEGKKITITVKTDKSTLGEAMYEIGLINDQSFFNVLIGMEASWEADQAYWAFYQGNDYMLVGVNDTVIDGGEHYRFVYTKQ